MDIDKLIRVYQKRFEKTVNASRILPSLLSHVDTVLGVKRFLEGLREIGVREVVLMKLPRDTTELRHPYPQEVIEFIRKVRGHGLDVFILRVFCRGNAYVELQDMATGFRYTWSCRTSVSQRICWESQTWIIMD